MRTRDNLSPISFLGCVRPGMATNLLLRQIHDAFLESGGKERAKRMSRINVLIIGVPGPVV